MSGSGPGVADTKTIDFPSGDHAKRSPTWGSGLLDPMTSAIGVAPPPSAFATMRPPLPSSVRPMNARRDESRDHRGADPSSAPRHFAARPDARSAIQISVHGGPGRALLMTVNAARVPSGEHCTSPADRK